MFCSLFSLPKHPQNLVVAVRSAPGLPIATYQSAIGNIGCNPNSSLSSRRSHSDNSLNKKSIKRTPIFLCLLYFLAFTLNWTVRKLNSISIVLMYILHSAMLNLSHCSFFILIIPINRSQSFSIDQCAFTDSENFWKNTKIIYTYIKLSWYSFNFTNDGAFFNVVFWSETLCNNLSNASRNAELSFGVNHEALLISFSKQN